MTADESLINAAKLAIRDNKGPKGNLDRDRLGTLITDYRAACDLTCGPVKARCWHWTEVAERLERRIRWIAQGGVPLVLGDRFANVLDDCEECL